MHIFDFASLRELIGEKEFDLATSSALQQNEMASSGADSEGV